MVIHLSIFDLFIAIPALFAEKEDFPKPNLKVYLTNSLQHFGNSGSMMLTCCFAHFLYWVGREGMDFLHSQYRKYTKISYTLALISAAIYYIPHHLDKFHLPNIPVLRHITPVFIFIQIVFCFFVTLYYYLSGFKLMNQYRRRKPWILLIYPVTLLFSNLPRNLLFCIYALKQEEQLYIIFTIFQSIWLFQGMLNALIYGLISGVREAMREQCFRRAEDIEDIPYVQGTN